MSRIHILVAIALCSGPPATPYIEASMSLGAVVAGSSNILVMQVDKVDKENNRILYKKIRDIKGTHPSDILRHNIAKAGFHAREWQNIMAWAEPGKLAVMSQGGCCSKRRKLACPIDKPNLKLE